MGSYTICDTQVCQLCYNSSVINEDHNSIKADIMSFSIPNPDIRFSVTLMFPSHNHAKFTQKWAFKADIIASKDPLCTEVKITSNDLQTIIAAINDYCPAFDQCRRLELYKEIKSSH